MAWGRMETGLLLPGSLPAPCTSRKLHIGGVGYAVLPPGLRCEPAASGSIVVWARGRTDGPHPSPAAYLVVARPAEAGCIFQALDYGQLTLTHIAQRPGKAVRCGTGSGYHTIHAAYVLNIVRVMVQACMLLSGRS